MAASKTAQVPFLGVPHAVAGPLERQGILVRSRPGATYPDPWHGLTSSVPVVEAVPSTLAPSKGRVEAALASLRTATAARADAVSSEVEIQTLATPRRARDTVDSS